MRPSDLRLLQAHVRATQETKVAAQEAGASGAANARVAVEAFQEASAAAWRFVLGLPELVAAIEAAGPMPIDFGGNPQAYGDLEIAIDDALARGEGEDKGE